MEHQYVSFLSFIKGWLLHALVVEDMNHSANPSIHTMTSKRKTYNHTFGLVSENAFVVRNLQLKAGQFWVLSAWSSVERLLAPAAAASDLWRRQLGWLPSRPILLQLLQSFLLPASSDVIVAVSFTAGVGKAHTIYPLLWGFCDLWCNKSVFL